jgi:ribosomal protein S18 acetylase RimI-like enzyme
MLVRLPMGFFTSRGSARGRTVVKIRDYQPDDGRSIIALQAESRKAAQWRVEDYQGLAADPGGLVLVAELEPAVATAPPSNAHAGRGARGAESLAGFVAFHRVDDEAELRNLAVATGCRRRGIARLLLAAGHRRLFAAGVRRVHLEVRASNAPALSLYSSLGYSTYSLRKAYYRDPEENAHLLSLTLSTVDS